MKGLRQTEKGTGQQKDRSVRIQGVEESRKWVKGTLKKAQSAGFKGKEETE